MTGRENTDGMSAATERNLQASIEIDAPPERVWQVVADVRRTGEWSPECRRVVPLGSVRKGTVLLGFNRRGKARWPTLSQIVRFEPGREIAWAVRTNRSVWSYRLEPTPNGTRVVESRETPRGIGRVAGWFTGLFLGGSETHDAELESGMASGLARVKALVEG